MSSDTTEDDNRPSESAPPDSTSVQWKIPEGKWRFVALGGLLGLVTFGLSGLFSLLSVALFLIIGALTVLLKYGLQRSDDLMHEFKNFDAAFSCGIKSFLGSVDRQERTYMYERLTGSPTLDPIVEEIVNYALRDFIESWYSSISNDESFRDSLKQSAYRAVAVLTTKMRHVDWTPLLTRHIVDDFASHIRIYRKARDKLRIDQINTQRMALARERQNNADDQTTSSSQRPDVLEVNEESTDGALESFFFDLELDMEKTYCRDLVSTSSQYENAYLHDVADILLYLIIPPEDFRCRPERFVLRECVVKRILLPVLDLFSDPDYLNQTLVWLVGALLDVPMDTDDLLNILSTSKHVEELRCMKEAILQEMRIQRSKDTGGQNDSAVKQKLGSLAFVLSLVDRRLKELMGASPVETATAATENSSLADLPLSFVLTKSLPLAYFIDFMQSQGAGHLIDLYLAIEGFKLSAEHQLASAQLNLITKGQSIDPDLLDNIREAAMAVFDQYLAANTPFRVKIDEGMVNALHKRIKTEKPSESWFDPVQQKITEILDRDVRYFPAFKMHPLYFRMLSELAVSDQLQSQLQQPDVNIGKQQPVELSLDDENPMHTFINHQIPQSDIEQLEALIVNIGIGRESNRAFATYNIRVSRQNSQTGDALAQWDIVRRYSDFHTLNNIVEGRFPNLANLRFPGKKTFNNLNQDFLEKRKRALNAYISALLNKDVMHKNTGLDHIILDFVCSKHFSGDQKAIGKRVMNFVNPIKSGFRSFGDAVISVPENVFDGVVKGVEGVGKVTKTVLGVQPQDELSMLNAQSSPMEGRVGADLKEAAQEETIPLRIMLLFMDDIFGMRGRNQWFRRSMVAFARQFVHAALGSSINRKIIEFFNWLTSEEQVAGYLRAFRDSFWPNGQLADSNPERPHHVQMRARVVTKAKLLSALPEQLRLFVGNETSREGVELVFQALQHPHLNRRLCYVLLERLLTTIFPGNRFDHILPKLHSKSPRCQQPV